MTDEEKKEEVQEELKAEESPQAQDESKTPDEPEKPLEKMTAPELREIAKQIPGVTGASAMKKDELLEIIKKHRGIEDEKPAKTKKKAKTDKDINVKDLKQKIIQLKEKKVEIQKEKDRKQINILRRRINRLKKRTRTVVKV
jgi:hypothetical protein